MKRGFAIAFLLLVTSCRSVVPSEAVVGTWMQIKTTCPSQNAEECAVFTFLPNGRFEAMNVPLYPIIGYDGVALEIYGQWEIIYGDESMYAPYAIRVVIFPNEKIPNGAIDWVYLTYEGQTIFMGVDSHLILVRNK